MNYFKDKKIILPVLMFFLLFSAILSINIFFKTNHRASAYFENCRDADEDGVLDYNIQFCSRGKDRHIKKAEDLTLSELRSRRPLSNKFNLIYGSNDDIRNLLNFKIQKAGAAEIDFQEGLNLLRINSENGDFASADIDSLVEIGDKRVKINTEDFQELGKKTRITFYNVRSKNPKIQKDGQLCQEPECKIVEYDRQNNTLTIEIQEISSTANRPPVLNPIGDKTVDEEEDIVFTISAVDPDNDNLTYSAENLPAGAEFSPDAKTFSWTPNYSQAGTYHITFKVSDGQLEDSEMIDIMVNDIIQCDPVKPCIISITPSKAAVGEKIKISGKNFGSYKADADYEPDYDLDADGEIGQSDIDLLTDKANWGLTINKPSFNPIYDLDDDNIIGFNDLMVINSKIGRKEGGSYVEAGGLRGKVIDWSDREITFIARYGTESGEVVVTTAEGKSSGAYFETDKTNKAPKLSIGSKSVNKGKTLEFKVIANDPNLGDKLFYSVENPLPSGANFNASSKIFSWTPNYSQAGTYHITFKVSDGQFQDSETVVIAVNDILSSSQNILIIYNININESREVADYYIDNRPEFSGTNLLGLTLTTGGTDGFEFISSDNFNSQIWEPLKSWLSNNSNKTIDYIVLSYGMPSRTKFFSAATSVQYRIYSKLKDIEKPAYITSLNMGNAADVKAYVDKLKNMYDRMAEPSILISARNAGYNNTDYYFDDVRKSFYVSSQKIKLAKEAVLSAGAAPDRVHYITGVKDIDPNITSASNAAGYFSWGIHGGLGENYANDGKVIFSGDSGWYIIETMESFNGRRNVSQGNMIDWFKPNAFGGSNYSNTPIGAVSYTEEPYLQVNDSSYFRLWEKGFNFARAAWDSRKTYYFQALGDPLVRR